jgi:hypothetical protein
MKMARTSFDGFAFASMSDEFLVENYDALCERTSESRPNNEDWLEEWKGCKDELLRRLSNNPENVA